MSSQMKTNSIVDWGGQDVGPSLFANQTVICSSYCIVRIGCVTCESSKCGSSW